MIRQIISVSIVICFAGIVSHAQQADSVCPQPVEYIRKGEFVAPFPYAPVAVSVVAGEVRGAIVGPPQARPQLCVALFTTGKPRLVATATTDQAGRFRFGVVRSGKFRLVIRAPGFYVTEIPVRVSNKVKISKPIDVVLQSAAMQKSG